MQLKRIRTCPNARLPNKKQKQKVTSGKSNESHITHDTVRFFSNQQLRPLHLKYIKDVFQCKRSEIEMTWTKRKSAPSIDNVKDCIRKEPHQFFRSTKERDIYIEAASVAETSYFRQFTESSYCTVINYAK